MNATHALSKPQTDYLRPFLHNVMIRSMIQQNCIGALHIAFLVKHACTHIIFMHNPYRTPNTTHTPMNMQSTPRTKCHKHFYIYVTTYHLTNKNTNPIPKLPVHIPTKNAYLPIYIRFPIYKLLFPCRGL